MKYTQETLDRKFRKEGAWKRQTNNFDLEDEFSFADAVAAYNNNKISKTTLDKIRKCQPGCHAKLTQRSSGYDNNDYVRSLEKHWNPEVSEIEEIEESLQGAIDTIDAKIIEQVGYLLDEKKEFKKRIRVVVDQLAKERGLHRNKYNAPLVK